MVSTGHILEGARFAHSVFTLGTKTENHQMYEPGTRPAMVHSERGANLIRRSYLAPIGASWGGPVAVKLQVLFRVRLSTSQPRGA